MKSLKRIFIYSLIGIAVIIIAAVASAFLFKDRIIREFITEANKKLGTPVRIGEISISFLEEFPKLAIVFKDVYIEDSHPGLYPLFTAKSVSFTLNPLEAYAGKYSIRGLDIRDSETNLRINEANKNNYTILKDTLGSGESISFELSNVTLVNTLVTYIDAKARQHHEFISDQLSASIRSVKDVYSILAEGDVTTAQIGVKDFLFLKDKDFEVSASLDYDDLEKHILFKPSTLLLDKARFEVSGTYDFKEVTKIDLAVAGKETDIQTVASLLPEKISKNMDQFRSDGELYFNLTVKGDISDTSNPVFSSAFGCHNAAFFHPETKSAIKNANLEGKFTTPSFSDFSSARLEMTNIHGQLNEKEFTADFTISNFTRPFVECIFKGEIDAKSLAGFLPESNVKELSGSILADISLVGEVGLLKNKSTAQQVNTRGSVELKQVGLSLGSRPAVFRELNGTMQFNNNDLALSDVKGQLENSDFLLNGFFKNVVTYILFENQPIGIETDLQSNFLDLDQLFEIVFGEDETEEFKFSISPDIHLHFNCDLKAMKYKRFTPRNVKGDLLVKNKVATSNSIILDAMGGEIRLSGIIDAGNPKAIGLASLVNLKGIHLDSIFYVFENFHQDFIQDKHLKGLVFSEIDLQGTLDEKLHLFSETLVANADAQIRNGELNEFEPLFDLEKHLDDDGLHHLRFADLKNEIHIENKMIIIPEMEVRTNVTAIKISGKHQFDQVIDYRLVAPLRNKKKINLAEAGNAFEVDNAGKMKVYFKVTGTTDDYKVAYDAVAVRKKMASDLKKEIQELKEAIRLKGKKKKKEVELSNEEFDN